MGIENILIYYELSALVRSRRREVSDTKHWDFQQYIQFIALHNYAILADTVVNINRFHFFFSAILYSNQLPYRSRDSREIKNYFTKKITAAARTERRSRSELRPQRKATGAASLAHPATQHYIQTSLTVTYLYLMP